MNRLYATLLSKYVEKKEDINFLQLTELIENTQVQINIIMHRSSKNPTHIEQQTKQVNCIIQECILGLNGDESKLTKIWTLFTTVKQKRCNKADVK